MSALLIILGMVIARFFWRQLLTAVAWACALLVCYVLLRYAPSLGLSSAWLGTMYGGTLLGVVAGVLLAYRVIINWHVEKDFERDVERARGTADKRRV